MYEWSGFKRQEKRALLLEDDIERLASIEKRGQAIVSKHIRRNLAEDIVGGEKTKKAGWRE